MTENMLTIRFTPDGFSFHDDVTCEIAPGQDFIHQLEESLLEKLPPDSIQDICCEFETTRFMLIPTELQDDQVLIKEMFDMTFSRPANEEVLLTQQVALTKTNQVVTLCFAIDHDLYNFLLRNYSDPQFCHPMASLLTEADRMAQGNCLVTRCSKRYLEIALFRGDRLQLCNSYHTSQADSRSYYVMNTWLQQGLDQLQDYLLVLGQGNEGLQIRASLHRFIKHVFS